MKKVNLILGSTHLTGFILVLFFISTQFFGCGGDEEQPKSTPPVEQKVEQKKQEPKPVAKQEEKVTKRSVPPGLEPGFIGEFYIVKPGDNLNDLARYYYGSWEHWRDIFHANEHRIDDWNILEPGTRLEIPPLKKVK